MKKKLVWLHNLFMGSKMKQSNGVVVALLLIFSVSGCTQKDNQDIAIAKNEVSAAINKVANSAKNDQKDRAIALVNAFQAKDLEAAYKISGREEYINNMCNEKYATNPDFEKKENTNKCIIKSKEAILADLMPDVLSETGNVEYLESQINENDTIYHYFKIIYDNPEIKGRIFRVVIGNSLLVVEYYKMIE